ncbi:MAG TPA: hypothetical protein VKV17_17735 [Bryobacteraceae bacterium]|nr:hypothetical protein [Bryobacteraceae bacterium]
MPRRAALLAALFPFAAGAAQVVCALGSAASAYKPGEDQRPTPDALELAGRLNAAVKSICHNTCPSVALFRNASAANVMLVADAGQAKLIYAPQFFSAAYEAYGDGGILALMAHELGHALDDTLGAVWIKSTWPPELRADAWAGCVLARADLAADEIESMLEALAKYPAPAHPSWELRRPPFRAGFTECGGDPSKIGNSK